MDIAVYDCIRGDALTEQFGSTGAQVIRWIAPHMPDAHFTSVHVAADEPLPPVDRFDGVIISGSEKGVYDDTSWMAPLRAHLLDLREAGVPVFGICFGHQIMADVFGGRAEKADTGFITGERDFIGEEGTVRAYLAHQDQVTEVPPGATVTASAPHCPVAALAYDFPALSVQYHPEFDAAFVRGVIDIYGPQLMTPEEAAAARRSLTDKVSPDLYAGQVARFFRDNA